MAGLENKDLSLLSEVAEEAANIAMKYFRSDNEVWMKSGNSPVSQADLEVNEYLSRELLMARPDYGWLSEETEDDPVRLDHGRTFVVDPIDGTRGFINGSDRWCISIAIVENGRPVAAVLKCPALDECYLAATDQPTLLNGDLLQVQGPERIRHLTGSRKVIETVANSADHKYEVTAYVPSLAYRIAMVANGRIDLAIARSGAQDWDLAAADLILSSAGGQLTNVQGTSLLYNQKNIRHEALIGYHANLKDDALTLAKTSGILH